jgi:hypothetical protein
MVIYTDLGGKTIYTHSVNGAIPRVSDLVTFENKTLVVTKVVWNLNPDQLNVVVFVRELSAND